MPLPIIIPFGIHLIDIIHIALESLSLLGDDKVRAEDMVNKVKVLVGGEFKAPDPQDVNYISNELKRPGSPIQKAYAIIMMHLAQNEEFEEMVAAMAAEELKLAKAAEYFNYVDELISQQASIQNMNDELFQQQLDEKKKRLHEQMSKLYEFNFQSAALSASININEARVENLQQKLIETLADQTQILTDRRIQTHEIIRTNINSESTRITDTLSTLNSQLEQLKQERDILLNERGEDDPVYILKNQEIDKQMAKIAAVTAYKGNFDEYLKDEEELFKQDEVNRNRSVEDTARILGEAAEGRDQTVAGNKSRLLGNMKIRQMDMRAKQVDEKNAKIDSQLLRESFGDTISVSSMTNLSTNGAMDLMNDMSRTTGNIDKQIKSLNKQLKTDKQSLKFISDEIESTKQIMRGIEEDVSLHVDAQKTLSQTHVSKEDSSDVSMSDHHHAIRAGRIIAENNKNDKPQVEVDLPRPKTGFSH